MNVPLRLKTQEPKLINSPTNLVLYDGLCPLCNRLVSFVLPRDREGVFHYASLQSRTGVAILERNGLDPNQLHTFYVAVDFDAPGEQLLSRASASLFVARHLKAPWRWVTFLRVLPRPILDWLYGLIARSRYRVFGRYDACPTPPPRYRDRFLGA